MVQENGCLDWPENPVIGETHDLGDVTYTYVGNDVWEGQQTNWTYDREVLWSDVSKELDPGNPTTDPANWHPFGTSTANWRAEREFKDGAWLQWSVTAVGGGDGASTFSSMVFIRQTGVPTTPTGGSYASPIPVEAGWSDGVPAGELTLWASSRVFSSDGEAPQSPVWTTPRQMTDTATLDIEWSEVEVGPGNPTDNPENWQNNATTSVWWKAERVKTNGVWGAWQIVKVRGEDGADGGAGADGNYGFKSVVFVRTQGVPTRPPAEEGNWANPVPAGWYDGAPAGEFALWTTSRLFTDDGLAPQEPAWALPTKLTNTSVQEFNYSAIPVNPGNPTLNPTNWHTIATPSDIWMAQRVKVDGIWGDWEILKIKGEDGLGASRGFNFFRIGTADGLWSDAVANSAVPDSTPIQNDVVTIYKATDPNINDTRFWNGGAWEVPADGGIFFGSIIVDGSIIGRHVAASISMTTPRLNGGILNGGTVQLIGPTHMKVESHTAFGPDNLLEWKGPRLTVGSGADENPDFAALTKANASAWFDQDGNQYYGGTLSAGILRASVQNTLKTEYANNEVVVELGPFSTNGNTKTVVVSHTCGGGSQGGLGSTCPVNPTVAKFDWILERRVDSGAWIQVASGSSSGYFHCEDGENQALISEGFSSSVTYTDNLATIGDFYYRVVCVAYDRFLATSNINAQSTTLVSTEE